MTDPRDRSKSGALGTALLVDPDGILFFFLAAFIDIVRQNVGVHFSLLPRRQGQTSLQSLKFPRILFLI